MPAEGRADRAAAPLDRPVGAGTDQQAVLGAAVSAACGREEAAEAVSERPEMQPSAPAAEGATKGDHKGGVDRSPHGRPKGPPVPALPDSPALECNMPDSDKPVLAASRLVLAANCGQGRTSVPIARLPVNDRIVDPAAAPRARRFPTSKTAPLRGRPFALAIPGQKALRAGPAAVDLAQTGEAFSARVPMAGQAGPDRTGPESSAPNCDPLVRDRMAEASSARDSDRPDPVRTAAVYSGLCPIGFDPTTDPASVPTGTFIRTTSPTSITTTGSAITTTSSRTAPRS